MCVCVCVCDCVCVRERSCVYVRVSPVFLISHMYTLIPLSPHAVQAGRGGLSDADGPHQGAHQPRRREDLAPRGDSREQGRDVFVLAHPHAYTHIHSLLLFCIHVPASLQSPSTHKTTHATNLTHRSTPSSYPTPWSPRPFPLPHRTQNMGRR